MNNTYKLNNLSLPEAANDNTELLTPNASQTLNALSEATRKSALEVISTDSNLGTLGQEVKDAHDDIERLSPEYDRVKAVLIQKIKDQLSDVTNAQESYIIDLIKAFHNNDDLIRVLQSPSVLENISEPVARSLVTHLETDNALQEFRGIYSEIKSKEPVFQSAAESLLERNIQVKNSISLRNRLSRNTGVLFNRNLFARLDLSYIDQSGNEGTFELKVKGLNASQTNPLLEIQYTDPITNENINAYISADKLANILFTAKAVNKEINSLDEINNRHHLQILGLSYQQGTVIEYRSQSGEIHTVQIGQVDNGSLELSNQVYINGTRKSTLSYGEFSKWLTLHYAYPKINSTTLESVLPKLNQIYNNALQPSNPNELSEVSFVPGVSFSSKLNNATIRVTEISDDKISYLYEDTPMEKTCSQFLQTLIDGLFLPSTSQDESDQSAPTSEESSQDKSDEPKETPFNPENKEVSNLEFGGTPTLLKLGTYTGALKSIFTLGGNITWFSYDDIAGQIIPKIVDNIKGSLETQNKLKLGNHLKTSPLIGEEFARMKSGAVKEIVEDYTTMLNRIGDWKKVETIICTTDDIYLFYAATNFLKEKGYLPVFDRRYLENFKKFDSKFTYPSDIQQNRSIVEKNLIDSYDRLFDPGTGLPIINGNKSNENNAIREYAQQAEEIFSENTNWGLTKLHRLLDDFSNDKDVDPHEFKGYLLGAFKSGEVDIEQLLTYIALGMTVKNSKGETMVKGYEGLLGGEKKAAIAFNIFMDGTQLELFSYLSKNILTPDGKLPPIPRGNNRATFEQRFGKDKVQQIQNFMYWTNLTKTVSKKQNAYLKEGNFDKDTAGYSLFTHDYRDLRTNFVFMTGYASGGRLTAEQAANGIKSFPKILQAYSAILSEGPEKYIKNPGNYPLLEEKIKNVIFTYILTEAAYTGRVQPGRNTRVGGTLSPDDLAGTKDKRQASQAKLYKIFTSIPGISSQEVSAIFQDYPGGETKLTHEDFLKNLESIMAKVPAATLVKAIKTAG